MKLVFLGTGVADWFRDTAHLGDASGVNRRCTSLLIDGVLLIDPGPDFLEALETFGCDITNVRWVLISHSHGDHYRADTLSQLADDHPIIVYGDAGYPEKLPAHKNITFIPLSCHTPRACPFGTLTAVPSTHVVEDTSEQCLHFILRRNGKTLFYGPDGAWFRADTWYTLETYRLDCVILDATFGDDPMKTRFRSSHIWFYHNSASMLKIIRQAMYDKKIADDHTIFVADHLARAYYPNIEAANAVFHPMGYVTAYDGMQMEI